MIRIPYYETSNFALSNFSAHKIVFDAVEYPTVEHAFHAQKFSDETLRMQIRSCGSPLEAWTLARELKARRRNDWNNVKVGILTELIRAKIQQHTEVKDALLATGTEEIIEINPNDAFWGNGKDGTGLNHTGKILMLFRDELVAEL